MGGGLMQLVAYGAQDIYLTGNPQITFFKVVYRRHTNFSMEAIEQTWNGTSDGTNGRCTATISRNGDLVHRMYLEVTGSMVDQTHNLYNPGISWIKTVELEIGGQKIDEHSGVWMETWAELTQENPSSAIGFMNHMGNRLNSNASTANIFQNTSGYGGLFKGGASSSITSPKTMSRMVLVEENLEPIPDTRMDRPLYKNYRENEGYIFNVPLQFWFCRNVGLALPLIALQYHEVKVILEHEYGKYFKEGSNKLYADYIYLDTDERRRFAQVSHEYLIEQVQEQPLLPGTSTQLNFNHPVKELIWTRVKDEVRSSSDSFDAAKNALAQYQAFLSTINAEVVAVNEAGGEPFTRADAEHVHQIIAHEVVEEWRKYFPPLGGGELMESWENFVGDANAFENQFPYQLFTSTGTALSNSLDNINSKITLKLNGQDRFSERPATYFSRTQILEHHTGPGGCDVKISNATTEEELGTRIRIGDGTIPANLDQIQDGHAIHSQAYQNLLTQARLRGVAAGDEAAAAWDDAQAMLGSIALLWADDVEIGEDHEALFLAWDRYVTQVAKEILQTKVDFTASRFIDRVPGNPYKTDSICVYSFALKPEEHQPSGTCNFSRIDNAQLIVNDSGSFKSNSVIFAVNYNVLRIMSGMGGLAYSN